jgi:glycosyltransferase involved in cell wall biosynthesis
LVVGIQVTINMNNKSINVLMVVEQCNPQWASVPLVAYRLYDDVSKLVNVTLVTHERNRPGIERVRGDRQVHYIKEGAFLTRYYKWTDKLVNRGAINWPLYHLLNYPLYASFNRIVYKRFKEAVEAGEYDIVHALTPMMPRYPVKLINACTNTPFILGPVNGGVPFPHGFSATARKEFAHFNFLRSLGRYLIPGYKKTYTRASKIFVGSTYTMEMLRRMFGLAPNQLELFYENGIDPNFKPSNESFKVAGQLRVLFVGRLVPYKGADMMLDAIGLLPVEIQRSLRVTIVGDGPELKNLEAQCSRLGLGDVVKFAGWIPQSDTLKYYQDADIFCFPSIREFGGAVVMEAMACGLPCIVVNNGGIGEYVTENSGFKIEPASREHIVHAIGVHIKALLNDSSLISTMSLECIERSKSFEWSKKSLSIVEQYKKVLGQ